MRKPALILGAVMLVVGILISAGELSYSDTDKVADFGKLELETTREKTAPVNWGYVIMGGGVLLLLVGAVAKNR